MLTQVVQTQDGSNTLFVPDIEEHYHSTYGAINESMYVFIEAGLNNCIANDISILEVGFGTGLNTFLTFIQTIKSDRTVNYQGVELNPLDYRKVQQLNYADILGNEDYFSFIHKCGWGSDVKINPEFILQKVQTDMVTWEPDRNYDLVYFDAFAPDVQPELWTKEIFTKLYQAINKHGVLTTYSAKGDVRRILEEVGFEVERLPGPPGKREMLRGIKR